VAVKGGKVGSDQYTKRLSGLRISELAERVERVQSRIKTTSDSRLIKVYREALKEATQMMEEEIIFAGEKLVEEGKNLSEVERNIFQWMIKDNPDSPWIETYRESLKRAIQRVEEALRLAEEKQKFMEEARRLAKEKQIFMEEARKFIEAKQEAEQILFEQEVENAVSHYEKAIGHSANPTRQMLKHYGYERALSLLMKSSDIQKGFKVLRNTNQLEKTFEAVIVRHEHRFDAKVVEIAQWRLDNPYWDKF
jgi:hypothetical protein